MSISFNKIQKQPVQLTNVTHYKLQNKQVLQACQMKPYENVILNGMPPFIQKGLVNKPISELKSMVQPFKPGMANQITKMRQTLGYTRADEKYITLNDMSNDLDTLDRADAFMKTKFNKTNGECLMMAEKTMQSQTGFLLKRAQCIQKTRPRMIGKTDQCKKRSDPVDFATLMTECP
jgi:hypothetical protein